MHFLGAIETHIPQRRSLLFVSNHVALCNKDMCYKIARMYICSVLKMRCVVLYFQQFFGWPRFEPTGTRPHCVFMSLAWISNVVYIYSLMLFQANKRGNCLMLLSFAFLYPVSGSEFELRPGYTAREAMSNHSRAIAASTQRWMLSLLG